MYYLVSSSRQLAASKAMSNCTKSTGTSRVSLGGRQSSQSSHSSSCRTSGSIFNLSGLSVSREARFLSKERSIPRTEFSPHLELIRSSEVDPFRGSDDSSTHSTPPPSSLSSPLALGYVMKELENMRTAKERSDDALRELRIKYKSREKEAAVLAFVVAFLTLGLVYPEGFRGGFQSVLQRIRSIQWRSDASSVLSAQGTWLQEDDGSYRGEQNSVLGIDSNPTFAATSSHKVRSSGIFWALQD